MRIQEPNDTSPASEAIYSPVYRVDFWSLEPGLVIEMYELHDAADVHEVEAWARERRPYQYTIYCLAPMLPDGFYYVRVAGYEPYVPDPIERFISNAADAARVQQIIDSSPPPDFPQLKGAKWPQG